MRTCAAAVLALAACAHAITRDQFYNFGPGDLTLPKGNDVPSPEIPLKVPIVFYGETYETVYVNNYGVLSFRADISSFLNSEFPLPYPSIAAFYSNVDTSSTGAVYYKETDEARILQKAEESVQTNFHDFFDFHPRSVFITTWADVTYSSQNPISRKNTFQIAIISNGTESFAEFLYPEGEIQWIQKETPSGQQPDAKAQAGFIAEDGRMYALRGSGSHQIRNIMSWSNVHEAGKYVFRIGNIPPDSNIGVPDLYNQYEIEEEEEYKTCAQSGPSVCHTQARCVDYQNGICCQCSEGYYGNGKTCIKDDVPIRAHGKINGVINSVHLDNVDIQAYVVVADGRSYTALSQVPEGLGESLQQLNILGSVVGWLFAKPLGEAKNGYQLTGGVLNHTAEIVFTGTGDKLVINQEYSGLDAFDQITMTADIRGTIPKIPVGDKLHIDEYDEQYTLMQAGELRSASTRYFTNKQTGAVYEQQITQTFLYNSCKYAPVSDELGGPSTVKSVKNYIGYELQNNIVRYGVTNKIMPLGHEDPCIRGRTMCGPHSSCVVREDTFQCVCQSGFMYHTDNACVDIDECTSGTHNCDLNAECINNEGSFSCRCQQGYEGDGVRCRVTSVCYDPCDENAECIASQCLCRPGFTGDGKHCQSLDEIKTSCEYLNNCNVDAECILSPISNAYECRCRPGFIGDGYSCSFQGEQQSSQSTTCYYLQNCHPDADCTLSPISNAYECRCRAGFIGNGYMCNVQGETQSTPSTCDFLNNCHEDAECIISTVTDKYECHCLPGYAGNGYECSLQDDSQILLPSTDTEENYTEPLCDSFDQCECPVGHESFVGVNGLLMCRLISNSNTQDNTHTQNAARCSSDMDCTQHAICSEIGECICIDGYETIGYECLEPNLPPECANCDRHAQCTQDAYGRYICVCMHGYQGEGRVCYPNYSCTNDSDCESNAECSVDSDTNEKYCKCVEGYTKDMNDACIPNRTLCNGAVCADYATCLFDDMQQVHYCECDPGYEGQGHERCFPIGQTCDVAHDCHPDAMCVKSDYTYVCVCKDGFSGDGHSCIPERTCRYDSYMCDSHASCLKRKDGYVCECNVGYFGNGTSCALNPRQSGNYLMASDGMVIYRVPFQKNRESGVPINSNADQNGVGINVDCQTGTVYWSDVGTYTIKRAAFDGSGFEVFLGTDINTEGIAIDWVARNIFWADPRKHTVEVANMDNRLRKVLFAHDGINNPRGIAVHPQRGKIFWSDWNRRDPKIEWANMDGSGRGLFLGSGDVKLPNSLAIDWISDRLCYTDAGHKTIVCVNIDTRQKETIATDCAYPFGLAIHDTTFYWTDWNTHKIEFIETQTGKKGHVPISTASKKLFGIAVSPERCETYYNVCQYRNGNCGYDEICLPDGRGGRTCSPGM